MFVEGDLIRIGAEEIGREFRENGEDRDRCENSGAWNISVDQNILRFRRKPIPFPVIWMTPESRDNEISRSGSDRRILTHSESPFAVTPRQ